MYWFSTGIVRWAAARVSARQGARPRPVTASWPSPSFPASPTEKVGESANLLRTSANLRSSEDWTVAPSCPQKNQLSISGAGRVWPLAA